ncbi:MAG: FapA family protein [bacterium]|nr:FapA family protein [bacterium]
MITFDESKLNDTIPSINGVRFSITQESPNSWIVQAIFTKQLLQEQEKVLLLLKEIKQRIAISYHIPVDAFEYDAQIKKIPRGEFVLATFRIVFIKEESGDPVIHFLSGMTPDGVEYPDMSATVDVCLLNSKLKTVTVEDIVTAANQVGIAKDTLNMELVRNLQLQVTFLRTNFRNFEIARGVFPGRGVDAIIEYLVPVTHEINSLESYIVPRRVKKGAQICRKKPAQSSKTPGYSCRGEYLAERKGNDIELLAGEGVRLWQDDESITAEIDGQIEIKQTVKRVKTLAGFNFCYPTHVEISVYPVDIVDVKDEVANIFSENTVEVRGKLRKGSVVVSRRGIIIDGNIEKETHIFGVNDVVINGHVRDSDVSSSSCVIVKGNIRNSRISSSSDVQVKGNLENCAVQGVTVTAHRLSGCEVVANHELVADRIEAGDDNKPSSFTLGRKFFQKSRITENKQIVDRSRKTLKKLELLFGKDILDQLEPTNLQRVFMLYLNETLKKVRHRQLDRWEMMEHRRLLEVVLPTRTVLSDKEIELQNLTNAIKSFSGIEAPSIMQVKNGISGDVEITIENAHERLQTPLVGNVAITAADSVLAIDTKTNEKRRRFGEDN